MLKVVGSQLTPIGGSSVNVKGLAAGRRARVFGLVKDTELNGQTCVLLDTDVRRPGCVRWKVRMPNGGGWKLSEANLEPVDEATPQKPFLSSMATDHSNGVLTNWYDAEAPRTLDARPSLPQGCVERQRRGLFGRLNLRRRDQRDVA